MPANEGPTTAGRRLLAELLDREVVDSVLVQLTDVFDNVRTESLLPAADLLQQSTADSFVAGLTYSWDISTPNFVGEKDNIVLLPDSMHGMCK